MGRMKKLLNNKLLMMPLVIVLTAGIALFLFAPGATWSVNKKYQFKAVKYCITMPIATALRAALNAIPLGIGKIIPIFCACGKDSNTFDSNFVLFATKQPQLDTEKQLKEAVEKMKEIVKQQKAMVKTGSPEALDSFMTVYKTLRSSLQAANALSLSTNFDADFKKRFPSYTGFNNMSDVEREAAEGWKKIMDGMMKALNVTARNFDEEQKARDALMNVILKAYADSVDHGQTYVLQYMGAVAAEGDALIDRTGAELYMTMEDCVHCQQIERGRQEAVRNNVTTIAGKAAKTPASGDTYNLGL